MRLSPPTSIERIAGSFPVEATATLIAALAGGPLAPMLPILTKCLASQRQRERVEKYLDDISRMLESHESVLRHISDAQFKLLNEAILAAFQTTQNDKLEILRTAVRHSLDLDIEPQEAILLSRIIRDISVEEALFVMNSFSYQGIRITGEGTPISNGILRVLPGSREELLVSGLLSLGVLTPGEVSLSQILRFSGIVAKLIVLLRGPDT